MLEFALIFLVSFAATFISVPWLIPKLKRAGLTGKDVNKPDKPEVPEMGGFAIVFGLSGGILLAIYLNTFYDVFDGGFQLKLLLAAFCTILVMAFVGIFDDLFDMRQLVKAVLPLFAALPLVAVKAGVNTMTFPFIGPVHLGIIYTLILIPIGVTGASNVTNMLAGFNGLEAGMGAAACFSLALIAIALGRPEAAIILIATLGALLAFLYYNWHPSRVLIGDIGTLTIGAVLASAVIIGNFETAGVIVIIPYAIDFFIKAVNRFPSKGWWGIYENGKLFCKGKPISFAQTVMKLFGGISERNLVLFFVSFELLFGLFACLLFLWK